MSAEAIERHRERGLAVVRVFVGDDGAGGNPLGVFLRGAETPADERQVVAAELGFSETVFVDDAESGALEIYTPGVELPFAGHPLVGTAWLLRERGAEPAVLRPPAGEVATRFDAERVHVRGRAEWAPPFELIELDSPDAVDAIEADEPPASEAYCWAWQDRERGVVRARSFAPAAGIVEDEATGSAAIKLAAALGRALVIRQGAGSRIDAHPVGEGWVEVGGRVALIEPGWVAGRRPRRRPG